MRIGSAIRRERRETVSLATDDSYGTSPDLRKGSYIRQTLSIDCNESQIFIGDFSPLRSIIIKRQQVELARFQERTAQVKGSEKWEQYQELGRQRPQISGVRRAAPSW